jgi:hypothetical protein
MARKASTVRSNSSSRTRKRLDKPKGKYVKTARWHAAKKGRPKDYTRPTNFSVQQQQEMIDWVSDGKILSQWCREHGFAIGSVFNFMGTEEGKSFKEKYTHAREHGTHAMAEETIEISDNKKGDVQRDKLRVETRARVIGLWNRKQYGTRPGDAEITPKLGLGELIEAAMAHGAALAREQQMVLDITPHADDQHTEQLSLPSAASTGESGEIPTPVVDRPARIRRAAT